MRTYLPVLGPVHPMEVDDNLLTELGSSRTLSRHKKVKLPNQER